MMWNVCGAMSAVLVGLKLAGILMLEWWQILMPLFVAGAVSVVVLLFLGFLGYILFKLEPEAFQSACKNSLGKVGMQHGN